MPPQIFKYKSQPLAVGLAFLTGAFSLYLALIGSERLLPLQNFLAHQYNIPLSTIEKIFPNAFLLLAAGIIYFFLSSDSYRLILHSDHLEERRFGLRWRLSRTNILGHNQKRNKSGQEVETIELTLKKFTFPYFQRFKKEARDLNDLGALDAFSQWIAPLPDLNEAQGQHFHDSLNSEPFLGKNFENRLKNFKSLQKISDFLALGLIICGPAIIQLGGLYLYKLFVENYFIIIGSYIFLGLLIFLTWARPQLFSFHRDTHNNKIYFDLWLMNLIVIAMLSVQVFTKIGDQTLPILDFFAVITNPVSLVLGAIIAFLINFNHGKLSLQRSFFICLFSAASILSIAPNLTLLISHQFHRPAYSTVALTTDTIVPLAAGDHLYKVSFKAIPLSAEQKVNHPRHVTEDIIINNDFMQYVKPGDILCHHRHKGLFNIPWQSVTKCNP